MGDVLLSWENEAHLALDEFGADNFEIVAPSESILAEPPVTWVDKYTDAHKSAEVAKAYLEFLYTKTGQELAAKHHFRPRDKDAAQTAKPALPQLSLFTVDEAFGGWTAAQKTHFADGGTFDQIYG
jgi:sulfate transport system substrate-binding protein